MAPTFRVAMAAAITQRLVRAPQHFFGDVISQQHFFEMTRQSLEDSVETEMYWGQPMIALLEQMNGLSQYESQQTFVLRA
jgi:hypothetical protein